MGRKPTQPPSLPGLQLPQPQTSTAVYQGVCKQINALFPRGDDDAKARKARLAGTIAQARSIAASIDRVSGDSGYQAAGMQLAAMHAQLEQLLARMDPTGQSDPFTEWLQQLDRDDDEVVPLEPSP